MLREYFRMMTVVCLTLGWPVSALSAESIRFTDIAVREGESLKDYARAPSMTLALWESYTAAGIFTIFEQEDPPNKWRGAPGVALFDYDNDGDLDIYVTNGPGVDNSLFSNQLKEIGTTTFFDVGLTAGVAANQQDSSGVCFGDIDNDGDKDLLVLSAFDANRLFENNCNGTFTDISGNSGLDEETRTAVGCSFGDVNGDGLLDVVVANNNLDWSNGVGIGPTVQFGASFHNQLYLNQGGGIFADVSQASGIEDLRGFPEGFDGSPSPTWAIAMVDFDLDGDVDIVQADDGFTNRGFNHLLENDGSGHFVDVTVERGLRQRGNWMGLSFGDLNNDGLLDFFASNVGDWASTLFTPLDPVYLPFGNYQLGDRTSRWFLGGADGVFSDPGVGALIATPFGWGTSMADYDNDGDTDIIYHGGLAFAPTVTHDNPGVILNNDGSGGMSYDAEALALSTDHTRRTVHGVAVGDLNNDGFIDIVSVSNNDAQSSIPLVHYGVRWESPFDEVATYQQLFLPTDTPGTWTYSGFEDNVNGSLAVEISSADNGNKSVKVRLIGTVGLVTGSEVNRDGIGAVIRWTTSKGKGMLQPVLGGSSYASQDSVEQVFGLGDARKGRLEILWPGGVRNRLYNVHPGERVLFPEIPCSFDGPWANHVKYKRCVRQSLDRLLRAKVITKRQKGRFFWSAIRAYRDARYD